MVQIMVELSLSYSERGTRDHSTYFGI